MDGIRNFEKRASRSVKVILIICSFVYLSCIALIWLLFKSIEEEDNFFLMMIGILGMIMVITVLLIIVINCRNKAKRNRVLNTFTSMEKGRLDSELLRAPFLKTFTVTSDAIIYQKGLVAQVIPIKDIIWIYEDQASYAAGMAAYKANSIRVYLNNKKSELIPIGKMKGYRDNALRYLFSIVEMKKPGVIIGYNDRVESDMAKRFDEVKELVNQGGIVEMTENIQTLSRKYKLS